MLDETDEYGKHMVEIQIDGPLTTTEVAMMSIMLHELTKNEGQRWSRSDARRKR